MHAKLQQCLQWLSNCKRNFGGCFAWSSRERKRVRAYAGVRMHVCVCVVCNCFLWRHSNTAASVASWIFCDFVLASCVQRKETEAGVKSGESAERSGEESGVRNQKKAKEKGRQKQPPKKQHKKADWLTDWENERTNEGTNKERNEARNEWTHKRGYEKQRNKAQSAKVVQKKTCSCCDAAAHGLRFIYFRFDLFKQFSRIQFNSQATTTTVKTVTTITEKNYLTSEQSSRQRGDCNNDNDDDNVDVGSVTAPTTAEATTLLKRISQKMHNNKIRELFSA